MCIFMYMCVQVIAQVNKVCAVVSVVLAIVVLFGNGPTSMLRRPNAPTHESAA